MPGKRILNLIPLIFWSVIILIKLIRIIPLYDGDNLVYGLSTIALTTPLDIVTFCFFYYLIIPSFISKNQIILNIVYSVLYILIFSLLWSIIYKITGRADSFGAAVMIYKSSLGHSILSLLYAVVLRLSVDWFNRYSIQKQLEKENTIAELALLRSQINPHFLFNTLNNINSFSQQDPVKTSFAIIKLSEIMRYMLYDAANESVPLEKEIDHINNIIALQKLRFKEKDFVRFEIEGDTGNIIIPPMLFLPFIENAFKHGSSNHKDAIVIKLVIKGDEMNFICKNRIKELTRTEIKQHSGIGIKNIKRRLELSYRDNYELHIFEKDRSYNVELNIKSGEH